MENINWYPGHMKKTKDLLKENLKLVDIVVEILDARIPLSSKNPDIDFIIGNKPKLTLLNKIDLSNSAINVLWKNHFESENKKCIFVNSITGEGVNQIYPSCRELMKEKLDSMSDRGRKERPIRIMIVGIPNVGKSSLINKLTGKKSAKVGNKPGITRGKQWVRLKENLELLDTPGILWPKIEDQNVGINLALIGAINDDILDIESLSLKLIEKLIELDPQALKERYNLDTISENALETLEFICKKRGHIISKGEFDYTRTANMLINEFRACKLGRISLELPQKNR